jgi:hypothetical protein
LSSSSVLATTSGADVGSFARPAAEVQPFVPAVRLELWPLALERNHLEMPVAFDSSISVILRWARNVRKRRAASVSTSVVSAAAVIGQFNIGFLEPATNVVVPRPFGTVAA